MGCFFVKKLKEIERELSEPLSWQRVLTRDWYKHVIVLSHTVSCVGNANPCSTKLNSAEQGQQM